MIDLCNPQELKALLARHGFHFSKSKGQNFLIQNWVPRDIVAGAEIDETCGVLEIGPGVGPLTQQLCLNAGKVVAIELDKTLQPVLSETLGEFENLEILWGDAMKMDIAALVAEKFQGLRPMACANLPYYITTPVLAALLEAKCFSSVTVMIQKEVAQRITAKPGKGDYGAFSVFCQYYSRPEILFDVPPNCFLPQPKVTSSVIRLTTFEKSPWEIREEALFFQVVRSSFAQRRKTLQNGLASGFPRFSKEELARILESCGLPPTVRGETLDIPAFGRIANAISRRMNQE